MVEKEAVETIIRNYLKTAGKRFFGPVSRNEPSLIQDYNAISPFIAALVPDEISKAAWLQQNLTRMVELDLKNIALKIATARSGLSYLNYRVFGVVKQKRFNRIAEVIFQKTRPNWEVELNYIRTGHGQEIPVELYFDIYVEDYKTGRKYAFDLESHPPNEIAVREKKKKLLTLYSMSSIPVDEAYYVLPYLLPDQKVDFYARWFDMKNDSVVLMGDEFWNKIGGEGTYTAFIDAVNAIGDEYKEQIYREYLGIEPPPDAFSAKLR